MPNDTTGARYRSVINKANDRNATKNALTRGLQMIAGHLGSGMSTESTIAVAYFRRTMYVAKLGTVNAHAVSVQSLEALLGAPLDGEAEQTLSVLNDCGNYQIEHMVGVGSGKTGLHAEMMIVKYISDNHLAAISAWDDNNINDLYIAASQGACPGCAGFMNQKNIAHTGVRNNGRCSSRWFNPIDDTACGSEVGIGLNFPDIQVAGTCRWS